MGRMRLAALSILCASGALLAVALWHATVSDLPEPGRAGETAPAPTTRVLDRYGRLLYEVGDPDTGKHLPIALSEIPVACRQATIATEDHRFLRHRGVDLLAIARALLQNARGDGMSGGSTLTQQLARNLLLSAEERSERTLRRKVREAWLALQMELVYPKERLLELYLNTTYYGHFAVGIGAAARNYFGVDARTLDLAQCTMLAGLPQSPARLNPTQNWEAAKARQAVVLRRMIDEGYLSREQAEEALAEGLKLAASPFPIEAPHFVMWTLDEVAAVVGSADTPPAGLTITTTLDLDLQRLAESVVSRRLDQLRPCPDASDERVRPDCDPGASPGLRATNAAVLALDPATGEVLAMVGSPDYFDATISGAVNGTLALRQPGSAIKPLTYAAAIDPERAARAGRHPWTAATVIPDIPATFVTSEGLTYTPMNYDRRFHGPVTVRVALANSYNVPAVRTLDAIGVDALVAQAAQLGIPWNLSSRFVPTLAGGSDPDASHETWAQRYGLAITLGGAEVRLLDLVAAYAAFGNGGLRRQPTGILAVSHNDGASAQGPAPHSRGVQAVDPRVAYIITSILADQYARTPAFGESGPLDIGRPAAVKTGTTSDWRDNWTIGYTPELAAGVWIGNADNAPMRGVSGIDGAAPIWHDFMSGALRQRALRDFAVPDGVIRLEVCADSGLLPLPASEVPPFQDEGAVPMPCDRRIEEWFVAGTQPQRYDMEHYMAAPARAAVSGNDTAPVLVWALPMQYHAWARAAGYPLAARGAASPALAAHDSGAASASDRSQEQALTAVAGIDAAILSDPDSSTGAGPSVVSPAPRSAYRLSPALPRAAQAIPVIVQPPEMSPDARFDLFVDGRPFAQVRAPDFTAWWTLERGRHRFSVVRAGQPAVEAENVVEIVVE